MIFYYTLSSVQYSIIISKPPLEEDLNKMQRLTDIHYVERESTWHVSIRSKLFVLFITDPRLVFLIEYALNKYLLLNDT